MHIPCFIYLFMRSWLLGHFCLVAVNDVVMALHKCRHMSSSLNFILKNCRVMTTLCLTSWRATRFPERLYHFLFLSLDAKRQSLHILAPPQAVLKSSLPTAWGSSASFNCSPFPAMLIHGILLATSCILVWISVSEESTHPT